MTAAKQLRRIKLLHTVVWALFVVCILAAPILAVLGWRHVASVLAVIVLVEVVVLAANRWRCPLTAVAARYTESRVANFDIYLPLWLAKYNKHVFGPLYALGLALVIWAWCR